jgi:hypothetical protein
LDVSTALDHIERVLKHIEISLGDLCSCRSSRLVQIRALLAAAEVKSLGMAPSQWDIEQGHEQIAIQRREERERNSAIGRKRDPRASVAEGRWYLPQLWPCRRDIENPRANRKRETRKAARQKYGSGFHRNPDSGSSPESKYCIVRPNRNCSPSRERITKLSTRMPSRLFWVCLKLESTLDNRENHVLSSVEDG